ncbi:unnamed protein product [Cylicostephanus goldi]|uniref:Uncharacterized protein n=1 Tax=Cylicostephanus goldi TaxID=71465 RepID=A0A3P7NNX7_CYLGO|nr:unnamed protein product [Cylicostephanus goldi]
MTVPPKASARTIPQPRQRNGDEILSGGEDYSITNLTADRSAIWQGARVSDYVCIVHQCKDLYAHM